MPHKKYLKGYRLERNIVNFARSKKMLSFRSAGSHSSCDVCIIDEKNKLIYFIQCKASKLSGNAKKKILDTLPREDEYLIKSIVVSDIKEIRDVLQNASNSQ